MPFVIFSINNEAHTAVLEITPAFLQQIREYDKAARFEHIRIASFAYPVQVYLNEIGMVWGQAIVENLPSDKQVIQTIDPMIRCWGDGSFDFDTDRFSSDQSLEIDWIWICATN